MSVPHPIAYQGSKRQLAPHILTYFPVDVQRLIEPFAGSAAVSLAALHARKVRNVLLNDSDAALMSLWQQIIDCPDIIADRYRALWQAQKGQERTFYDQIRTEFNQTHRPDHFLYLLARCVKAAVRYNSVGEFNQSPDNRRKGTHPDTIQRQILAASAILKGKTVLRSADYRDVLHQLDQTDLVYFDPPYQGVCQKRDPRYREKIQCDQFVDVLHELNRRHISYIVSYDGRTGNKTYGQLLPASLNLTHIELMAGRSSQATLLGRTATTFESLYLSAALIDRLPRSTVTLPQINEQACLFELKNA